MLDRWFSTIKLPLSLKDFHQLPQNPAYGYEYIDKAVWLTPSPKFYSARLRLSGDALAGCAPKPAEEMANFRRFTADDWPGLLPLFTKAFRGVQPFASLTDRRKHQAATACLKLTREGGDGPLIEQASHIAVDPEDGQIVGAVVVTLIPLIDLDDFWSMRWTTPPPADCIEQGLGRPHMTWIFVDPELVGHGIGSTLLERAALGLIELGYGELISSFLIGNTSSMLWHWRNGFELLPYVASPRRMRARWKK
jgi:GNAT superfamily N-acetyltransferase